MDLIIQVTKPGNYKRKKVEQTGRLCVCGSRLSIYNSTNLCSPCNQKQFLTEYGDKA